MNRALLIIGLLANIALAAGAAGCTFHRSPISQWYFYDRQTGEPIDRVLLLEWTERNRSTSPEAQAFEQQVPSPDSLVGVRGVWLTRAEPGFRPVVRGNIEAYAMTWSQRPRHMACCPGYGFRVNFASQEELAKLNVDSAGDESIAHVMLSRRSEPATAVDWLAWLANGRAQLGDHLPPAQRKRVWDAFAAYWEQVVQDQPAQLQAELAARSGELNLRAELTRIYREEVARPALSWPLSRPDR